jgi:hypothetical protein
VIRFALRVGRDACFCELGQPDRQVDVRARVVDRPVRAEAVVRLAEHDAAEVERALKRVRRGAADRLEESSATATLSAGRGSAQRDDQHDHRQSIQRAVPPHLRIVCAPTAGVAIVVRAATQHANIL